MLKYLSICSGIEAVTQAWHGLGYEPVAFAEIEPFPCAVLAHHYPSVPNLGDMSRFRDWDPQLLAQVDILVGGTPCQAFSVAGLRNSLDDERGNLTLTFVHLYDHITAIRHAAGRPAPLLLWENVPGVLNTPDNALGCFLGGLAGENGPLRPPGGKWHDAGYVRGPLRAIAWRILDAQYFGLAQRRERVFLVAGPRDHFHPEQVLFECDRLRRDTPPRREPGEGAARGFETGPTGGSFTDLAPTLDTRCKDGPIRNQLGIGVLAFGGNNTSSALDTTPALNANRGCHNPGDFEAGTLLVNPPLTCSPYSDNLSEEGKLIPEIAHTLRGERFDAGKDGTGRGTPLIPIAFPERMSGTQCASTGDLATVLQSHNPTAIAFQERGRAGGRSLEHQTDLAYSLNAPNGGGRRQELNICQPIAFNLRGREGGAMPELDPDGLACQRASSGGSSRSYVATHVSAQPLPFDTTQITSRANRSSPHPGDPCHPLASGAHPPAIAFSARERGDDGRGYDRPPQIFGDVVGALDTMKPHQVAIGLEPSGQTTVNHRQPLQTTVNGSPAYAVRRLTPRECERLQGFPDDYTRIPWRGKAADQCPDGPRYKALGNSMAVPVITWLGQRLLLTRSTTPQSAPLETAH